MTVNQNILDNIHETWPMSRDIPDNKLIAMYALFQQSEDRSERGDDAFEGWIEDELDLLADEAVEAEDGDDIFTEDSDE